MIQGSLFDPVEGDRRRDDALERVERGAKEDWLEQAEQAVLRVAARQEKLTSDDVWAELRGIPSPRERRAMGPVLKRCESQGMIEYTDSTRRSSLPQCHRRPVRVWRSKLHRP
jgi:hypothetical protein